MDLSATTPVVTPGLLSSSLMATGSAGPAPIMNRFGRRWTSAYGEYDKSNEMEDMMVFELLAERCWLAREDDIQVKSTFQQFSHKIHFFLLFKCLLIEHHSRQDILAYLISNRKFKIFKKI